MTDVVTQFRVNEAARRNRRESAELVFNYPQYTIEDALEMPIGDRNLLLTYARLDRAERLLELAGVIAASQSDKGYKKRSADLEGVVKDLAKQL